MFSGVSAGRGRSGQLAGQVKQRPGEVRQQRTLDINLLLWPIRETFAREKLITVRFTSEASQHNMLSSNSDYIQVLAGKVFYVYSAGNQDHKSAICID